MNISGRMLIKSVFMKPSQWTRSHCVNDVDISSRASRGNMCILNSDNTMSRKFSYCRDSKGR